MKILQVTPYYLPHKGGIERYVYNLSKSLFNRGHEVLIYTSNIPQTNSVENEEGVSIFRFKSLFEPFRNPLVPRLFFPTKNLQKIDLIHVHMIYSTLTLYGILQKKFFGIPLVMTHHGRMRFGHKFIDFFVDFYEKLFFKMLLSQCDRCIALSESDARFLASFVTANKISIIPNAINSAELLENSKQDIDQFLKIHNIENKKIILFVGRLIPVKGINYLIEAFCRVKNKIKDPSIVLLIVGDGDECKSLKIIVRDYHLIDSVIFTGELSKININYLYQSSCLFVLPSLSEGFPTAVLEAMYYGVPVIGTDIPVMKQNFSTSALLIPPRNSRALADAMFSLLSDPEYTLELSKRGKEKVINNFTWEIIVKKYLDVYSNIVTKRSS
jgi:glycosyltransferase involved in cell wall biosynthesis